MNVTALAGGVGGAKLAVGLQSVLRSRDSSSLTVIVNTADDDVVYGLHVSPDVDIVTYWLAGLADTDRGWGLRGDTFAVVDALDRLGVPTWFRLGDRDMATCLYRTHQLRAGASPASIADDIRKRLGVWARVVPMSDDPVRSVVTTKDGRTLAFQEYFVKERHMPEVATVTFEGIENAKPSNGVLDAIASADVVIVCPSNPVVSIGPILALPGVRNALVDHARVMAVSPIVERAPLKGPADKLMHSIGVDVSAAGVAWLYRDFCDVFVIDARDESEREGIERSGTDVLVTDTIMVDHHASAAVAAACLDAS